eukprot:4485254-Prymnesium_polylepis.1
MGRWGGLPCMPRRLGRGSVARCGLVSGAHGEARERREGVALLSGWAERTEVCEARVAYGVEQYILWLQVAVDHLE